MEILRSTDGTTIAYARSGHGTPLVLVHGTAADHTRWNPLLPELERHRTVFAIDRRGRAELAGAPRRRPHHPAGDAPQHLLCI